MNAVAVSASQPATPPRPRSKPMLPVRGVCSIIDKNEDQALKLIEDGSIAWAFNVAVDPTHGRNRHLRILPAAVADYMHGRTCSLEWKDVLSLLLPDAPLILSREITRVLNCSYDHTYNLVARKELVPCSTWRRGPGGCARFPRATFVEFLRRRRVQ